MVEGGGLTRDEVAVGTRYWGLFLVTGILWLVFAFIVLSFDITTVYAISILAGCTFIVAGVTEFAIAGVVDGWRWLHVLVGVLGIVAGVVAFAWPDQTFLVLAAILAFYLLFKGIFDIVMAFFAKDGDDMWWLLLVIGIVELLVGFWAVSYAGRAVVLLVIWVAATALLRGINEIILAFRLRSLRS